MTISLDQSQLFDCENCNGLGNCIFVVIMLFLWIIKSLHQIAIPAGWNDCEDEIFPSYPKCMSTQNHKSVL